MHECPAFYTANPVRVKDALDYRVAIEKAVDGELEKAPLLSTGESTVAAKFLPNGNHGDEGFLRF